MPATLQHSDPAKIEGLNFNDPFIPQAHIFILAYYRSKNG